MPPAKQTKKPAARKPAKAKATIKDGCPTCRYYNPRDGKPPICNRYPQKQMVSADYGCGEHAAKRA